MLYLWWPDCWLVGDLRHVSWTGAEVAIGMFHSIGSSKWGFPHGLGSVCDCSTPHCCCCCHCPGCPWSSCVPGSYAWVRREVLFLNHAPESSPKDNNKKGFNPNTGHWNKCKNLYHFKFKINEKSNLSCTVSQIKIGFTCDELLSESWFSSLDATSFLPENGKRTHAMVHQNNILSEKTQISSKNSHELLL